MLSELIPQLKAMHLYGMASALNELHAPWGRRLQEILAPDEVVLPEHLRIAASHDLALADWIENGRKKHQYSSHDPDNLRHVAQIDAERNQKPGKTKSHQDKGKDDQRQLKCGRARNAEEQKIKDQPDHQTDQEVKSSRTQRNDRQYL